MTKNHKKQLEELTASTHNFATGNGDAILTKFEESSSLILCWINTVRNNCLTNIADELLIAVSSSIREAAAFAAIGLVRPCLFSLRAQVDLLLSWLYFKDHPIEYATVCRSGDGFVLKKEALFYLNNNYKGFNEKLGILNQTKERKEQDPYRLLSAHIHSQSPFVISEINNLKDVVKGKKIINECITLQSDVAEYLSDILYCSSLLSAPAIPEKIKTNIRSRVISEGQRSVLFSEG